MVPLEQYIWPFLGALGVSLFLTPMIREWALKHALVSKKRPRDIHQKPTPRLGGVAIVASFWLVILILLLVSPHRLTFVYQSILGIDKNLFGVILGGLVIISVMIVDDLKGLPWWGKLSGQFLAAILVAGFGITIHWFSNPFGDQIELGKTLFSIGALTFSWGQIFVVIWLMAVMNIINWLDGLDGLASGIAVIAAFTLFLLSITPSVNQPATALLGIILAGSVLGFLPFNTNPAKIFLGDTGSMFIGYILGILAIISGGKVATASLVLGVPILDSLWVIGYRLWHKHSPFQADQNHLHHRLIKAGLHPRQIVLIYYLLSAVFGFLALKTGTIGKFQTLLWLVGVVAVIIGCLIVLEWRKRRAHVTNH